MSSLPAEVDFTANPAATSARMDQAMAFLVAWLRRVESVQPEFLAVTEQLKAVGLSRLDEVLSPIFLDAQGISAQLAAIRTAWLTGQPLTQLLAELTAQVTGRLTTVDGKLSDVDARLAANLASVTSQLGNNNAAVTAQLAGSATSVGNQLTAQNAAVDGKLAELSPAAKWAAASADEARSGTASRLISAAVLWAMQGYVAINDAATVAPDLKAGSNFTWTIGGNRVLANPINARPGQHWTMLVSQGGAGNFVMSFGSAYVPDDNATFPGLNLPVGAVTELRMRCTDDGKVRISGGKTVSGVPSQYLSGRLYGPWMYDPGVSNQQLYSNTFYLPIEIKSPVTIDAIACHLDTSSGSASVAVYTMVAGKPGALLAQRINAAVSYATTIPLQSNVTLSPGLYFLAIASNNGAVRLWSSSSGIGIAQAAGQDNVVSAVAAYWQSSPSNGVDQTNGFISNPAVTRASITPQLLFRAV